MMWGRATATSFLVRSFRKDCVMKRDTKNLVKAAKEVFAYLSEEGHFEFGAPDYVGISDGVFNQLHPDHLDALQAAVVIWKQRVQNGQTLLADDFVGLSKDEYNNLMPELHDKHDKPGKKHDKKRHDEDDFVGGKHKFR